MADVVSVLTGGSNSKTTTAEEINAPMTDLWTDGVVGTIGNTAGVAPMTGALAVNAQGTPDMTVAVTAGVAYVTCTPTSQGSQRLRANIATQNATIAANSTGGTRYDWIYVAMSASGAANPAVDGTGVATITVSRSTSSSTDNGTPPTYGYNIAVVTVSNGAATITNGNITDQREIVALSATNSNTGWITAEATPNTVTALGNRSYSMVFNSIDMTDTLSPGMRLKLTRTVTAPTQCTSLNGTTQYYSKATPNKMTFTTTFTVSAWVKLSSYGATTYIVSRQSGTTGWALRVAAAGYIDVYGWNAGNGKIASSYQAIPLNKWVHVAGSMNMASTGLLYFDGVLVQSATINLGAGAVALAQSGDLNVGASAGAGFFPGKIAQVAVYDAVISAATILASMHQTLSGSETNLLSAYSFNNSKTDLNTTTPNDLTANGSAVETNADSPFAQDAQGVPTGTTEYAVITKTAFSTNTTLTVQVPEGNAIPTSGGVSALSYSTQAVPLGFISDKGKWDVLTTSGGTAVATAIGTINTWYPYLYNLKVPIGRWRVGYQGTIFQSSTVAGLRDGFITIDTATPTSAVKTGMFVCRMYSGASTSVALINAYKEYPVELSAVTTYTPYGTVGSATGSETYTLGAADSGPFIIFARCSFI